MKETVDGNGKPQLIAPIAYESEIPRNMLNSSYSLHGLADEKSRPRSREELTVAMAAQVLGRSKRTVQRMLIAGQLKGRKIDGPNGPQWRVDRLSGPFGDSDAGVSKKEIADLEARLLAAEGMLSRALQNLHAFKTQAENAERKCYEMINENKSTIGDLHVEAKRSLQDHSDTVLRQAEEDLQAMKSRLLTEPIILTETQLASIGKQLRNRRQQETRKTWWQTISALFGA